MKELPESYHVVQLGSVVFYIDADTRKEIEAFLRSGDGPYDHIVVESIPGEEVTVVRDAVNSLWSTDPEQRARSNEMDRRVKAEDPRVD